MPCRPSSMTEKSLMYPSSLSTRAMPTQIPLLRTSTRADLLRAALRMRVSMSAIVSVSDIGVSEGAPRRAAANRGFLGLPGSLSHAGDLAFQRELAEHQPRQLELAV